jgi:hypothetical protein
MDGEAKKTKSTFIITTLIHPYVSFRVKKSIENKEWKMRSLVVITKAGGSINDNLTAVTTNQNTAKK